MADVAPIPELSDEPEALSEAIFGGFVQMLTPDQVRELYTMCLDDADRRIRQLQENPPDAQAFRATMHAIKGTCGMVGAVELAAQAAGLETGLLPSPGDPTPYENFLCASARLRRILAAKSIPL